MKKVLFKLCFVATIFGFYSCQDGQKTTRKNTWVKVDTVNNATFGEMLQFPAKVKASQEVNMAFKVSGLLQQVFVEEGQRLKKGDLLAQIDSRDYELLFQAVEAEYLGIKSEAERVIDLYADSVATTSEYDKARYGLNQIKAKYENAKNQLADTKIYAPFDGVVKTTFFNSPTVVGAGMPILSLLSSEMPEVEIHVPASTFYRLDDIASYRVKFDFCDKPMPLRRISVSPNANANQLYTIRLALPTNTKVRPTAGMSAMVDITFNDRDNHAVSIPASALFSQHDESFVWIYANGTVTPRKVAVSALHADGTATITDGLATGETIVTAGVKSLKSNQAVKPLQPKSTTNIGGLL